MSSRRATNESSEELLDAIVGGQPCGDWLRKTKALFVTDADVELIVLSPSWEDPPSRETEDECSLPASPCAPRPAYFLM